MEHLNPRVPCTFVTSSLGSVVHDVEILLATIPVVLSGRGAY